MIARSSSRPATIGCSAKAHAERLTSLSRLHSAAVAKSLWRAWFSLGLLLVCQACVTGPAWADEQVETLIAWQTSVASRYQKLEELLLRLADMEAAENPDRAALLKRAAKQSRDRFVLSKLEEASTALTKQQFQTAVDRQEVATKELASLLKLLLTEDRSNRIRDEKQRIAKVIKELKRVERAQRSTRARTENGADTDQLGEEQEALSERGDELSDQLSDESEESAEDDDATETDSEGEATEGGDTESKPGEEQAADGQKPTGDQQDASESESPPSDESSADESQGGESKDGEPKSGQSQQQQGQQQQGQQQQGQQQQGQQQQGQQQQGQQQQGQQQQQQPSSPQDQAQDQIQRAVEKMREAEKALEQAKRDEAVEQQRQAEENLRAAIDQLEQILRQLREEEIQRELARLESRLRQMAAMQAKVLDDTVALSATPKTQRNRQTDLKAGDLAFEEKKITLESDRALLLLREEGSSVAFPEVILQIREDTVRVTERLSQTKIDGVTQGIQEDILAALEEMIAALQKAQQDNEKKKQQQQQQQQQSGSPEDMPLVQILAELKLIRTMETRVKKTTERYDDLLQAGETDQTEVRPLLQNLAERQTRLYRITRDLVLKRNQ